MNQAIRVAAALAVACLTLPVLASVEHRLSAASLAPLRRPAAGVPLRLEGLPIGEKGATIELLEFQLWTPDGVVTIHGKDDVRRVPPPARRFFRGLIDGDAHTFAFFAVDPGTQEVSGLIVTRNGRFAVRSERPRRQKQARATLEENEPFDFYLAEADQNDLLPGTEQAWSCLVDRAHIDGPGEPPAKVAELAAGDSVSHGLSGNQSYAITLEVETDYEYYENAGSDEIAAMSYVINLVGAMATIYDRDLNTHVRLSNLHIYSSSSDPWSQTGGLGLLELGDYYHSAARPGGRITTAVTLLSGKSHGGGVAWEGRVGGSDSSTSGGWAGPYSWNGGIGRLSGNTGLGSIPDPDATVSGVPYGMPSGLQNYWPLAQLAHEVGHNLGGHHTHCIGTTDAERIASGFTDGSPATSASNQVDHCYGGDGDASCYAGTNYKLGSETIFRGTIMSYCHNVRVSDVPQSRFVFGPEGEPSHRQLTDYMLRPGGPLQTEDGRDGGPFNLVNALSTFSLTSVTVPALVQPSSTGNVASMVPSAGSGTTFFWEIVNGTITAGRFTSSVTFTAGASGAVTLRALAFGSNRVGVAETRVIPIAASFTPPANVVATATGPTSVQVTWSAVIGATQYKVHRASTAGSFTTLVGTTAGTSLVDNTAVANTVHQYVVTAGDGVNFSTFSDHDIAHTFTFTDPVITAQVTSAKAAHFTELLAVVNAALTFFSSPTITLPAPAPSTTTTVRASHVAALRSGVDTARALEGLPALSYGETLTAGATTIKRLHIQELRDGLK